MSRVAPHALCGLHPTSILNISQLQHQLTTKLDAISILGTGNALIEGGGAQNAKDKVIQHNGKGTVTVKK